MYWQIYYAIFAVIDARKFLRVTPQTQKLSALKRY